MTLNKTRLTRTLAMLGFVGIPADRAGRPDLASERTCSGLISPKVTPGCTGAMSATDAESPAQKDYETWNTNQPNSPRFAAQKDS